jgi:hypothetical protein
MYTDDNNTSTDVLKKEEAIETWAQMKNVTSVTNVLRGEWSLDDI